MVWERIILDGIAVCLVFNVTVALFWTGYVEMFFVNLGDFFGLDWFFRGLVKDKGIMIAGTEHCEAWNLSLIM